MKTVKELKKGDFFTRKPISEPRDNQVWIRGEYIRSMKAYECTRFSDCNSFCYLKGNQKIFLDFTF